MPRANDKMYSFEVFPVIYHHPEDHRKDKKSDYVLVRLRNNRTIAIIELKTAVYPVINADDKVGLAQLFYEAILRRQRLQDHHLHICQRLLVAFLNMSLVMKECKTYFRLYDPRPEQIYTIIQHYNHFSDPFRRYCFNKLPFGNTSAPKVFQKRMSTVLTVSSVIWMMCSYLEPIRRNTIETSQQL